MKKNNINLILKELKHKKMVALVAPSFVADFEYPKILSQLEKLGFDKIVELTFGAKLVNREYHKILKSSKGLVIATVCPGIVEVVNKNYPKYKKNLIRVDSPMIAMAKICKKIYPKHKTVFLSPCDYKKIEANKSKYVDYVIDYEQLREIFKEKKLNNIKPSKKIFDKFYNDYTKIYPLAGGLSKTAHLNDVIKKNEIKHIDGIKKVMQFLDKPDKKIKFLDVNFCVGGCIGGSHTCNLSIAKKKKRIIAYLNKAKRERIPLSRRGTFERAEGLKFTY
ncbi:hypothetical protein J4438_00150 [Candidatus Woesearchaeota archaeon]|nr:hypothetical protein [Candidatus Woesearchaeota archaeon]